MAFLHRVRGRGHPLRFVTGRRIGAASALALLAVAACGPDVDPSLQPDAVLQSELGLAPTDRVYRVEVTGGEIERADPAAISIEEGAFVEFITMDWLVHEILFEVDSVGTELRAFLERTGQVASPPLIQRESRHVLTFAGAPPGRYRYRLEGNGRTGRGVIVVAAPEGSGSAHDAR